VLIVLAEPLTFDDYSHRAYCNAPSLERRSHMLDDVADVATVAQPVPRSPDKPALDYLRASGAAPIFVTETDDVATIRTGSKVDPRAVVVFWIAEVDAKPVVKVARRLAGKDQNVGDAVVSLKKAAVECRATLTPHMTSRCLAQAPRPRGSTNI
jgi:hypothetical protein